MQCRVQGICKVLLCQALKVVVGSGQKSGPKALHLAMWRQGKRLHQEGGSMSL